MTHPLVRTQPESGKKSLFMGEHASHLDDRPFEAGRARLAELEAHATQERFIYRHHWRPGDVLMWDNRCLLHRADAEFRRRALQARAASHLPARHRARLTRRRPRQTPERAPEYLPWLKTGQPPALSVLVQSIRFEIISGRGKARGQRRFDGD